jgi:hypothetical protein
MAGENTLPVQYYPDDFDVVSFQFDATAASIGDPTPLLYADRQLIIDNIVVGLVAASGSGTDALTFRNGTDFATLANNNPLCLIDTFTDCAAGDTIVSTSDGVVRTNLSGQLKTAANNSTAINAATTNGFWNVIPQGSWLLIDTGTITSLKCTIQIRYRSRPK